LLQPRLEFLDAAAEFFDLTGVGRGRGEGVPREKIADELQRTRYNTFCI
jgi:hypothetical protein